MSPPNKNFRIFITEAIGQAQNKAIEEFYLEQEIQRRIQQQAEREADK